MTERQVRSEIDEIGRVRRIRIKPHALDPVFQVLSADGFGRLPNGERVGIYLLNFSILEFNVWGRKYPFLPYAPPDVERYRILEDPRDVIATIQFFNDTFVRSQSKLISEEARGTFLDNCPWG